MANQIALTQAQLDQISALTNGGTQNFYLGYKYISDVIANNNQVDAATKVWFQRAAEINSNDPNSAANTFIRSVAGYGLQYSGQIGDLNKATNDIGTSVIGDILNNSKGIPALDVLVGYDISTALSDNNISIGGWGGGFYYWNLTVTIGIETLTLGEFITKTPAEYNKFVAANAAALVKTVGSEWNGAPSQAEYLDMLQFGFGSDLPLAIKMDILDRAISSSSSSNYAGSPNMITGFTLDGLAEKNYGYAGFLAYASTDIWFYNTTTGVWYTIGDFGTKINATSDLTITLNDIRNDRLSHQTVGNYLGNQTFDNLGTGVFSTFAYGETATTTPTNYFSIANSVGSGAAWSSGLTADFANGIALSGNGYGLSTLGSTLNGDGFFNVAQSAFYTDFWRPGAYEMSDFDFSGDIGSGVNWSDTNGAFFTSNLTYNSNQFSTIDYLNNYQVDSLSLLNIDPLVLDLTGAGIQLNNYSDANVLFNMDADEYKEQTGWIKNGTGFLVMDKNGDGVINDVSEIFSEYFTSGAKNGLEALKTFDSNKDGVFNASDSANDNFNMLYVVRVG